MIDNRMINIPCAIFVDALKDASEFLGNPEWLTYQWGIVGPFRDGINQTPIELSQIAQLGLELRDLSRHENFAALIAQFSNPTQFFDTMFEVRVASLFSRFNGTTRMCFAPLYVLRNHEKRPEFDVHNHLGLFTVECKQPHMFVQRAAQRFRTISKAVHEALKAAGWPNELRLEVKIMAPPQEAPESFGKSLVDSVYGAIQAGRGQVAYGTAEAFIVPRKSPYRITDVKFWEDVMIIDDEATGLLNPNKTMLRVADDTLDHKFARSTGARIAEALKQLPSDHWGIIVLGGMPRRIAEEAVAHRIGDRAYDDVVAFIIFEEEQFHFQYRPTNRKLIEDLLRTGIRPLFPS